MNPPPHKHKLHLSKDSNDFCKLAQEIIELYNATLVEKLDGLDQSYWDIHIEDELFTLHREHYLGVFIFSNSHTAKDLFDKMRKQPKLNT